MKYFSPLGYPDACYSIDKKVLCSNSKPTTRPGRNIFLTKQSNVTSYTLDVLFIQPFSHIHTLQGTGETLWLSLETNKYRILSILVTPNGQTSNLYQELLWYKKKKNFQMNKISLVRVDLHFPFRFEFLWRDFFIVIARNHFNHCV